MSVGMNAQLGGFQLMRARIAQSGRTLYDEQVKDAQDLIAYGFTDDVSYNPYMVDYDDCSPVMIKMYGQSYTASYGFASKFLAPHSKPIELGQLLYDTKRNEYWLCVESYDTDGIYNEGRLGKCGRFLKWQDKNGIIKQTPMIVTSASKYNNGEDGVTVIKIGSDQLMVYLQLNEDTVLLDRGMKFFVDENKYNPSVYELTRNDTALYSYMGKGFLALILTECSYTPTETEFELGVCEYVEPSHLQRKPPKPVEIPPESPEDDPPTVSATIIGKEILKVGFPRTYSVEFMDVKSGEPVRIPWKDVDFEWEWDINCGFKEKVTMEASDNNHEFTVSVDDPNVIDGTFLLQVSLLNIKAAPVIIGQKVVTIEEGW